MRTTTLHQALRTLAITGMAALASTACTQDAPLVTEPELAPQAALALLPAGAELNQALAELRRATARYHDLDAALADGFVFLHGCEVRPGEGPVGTVYVHFGRLLDGVIDPTAPEALIYEPSSNGRLKLVGAELVTPFALWTEPGPPEFFGAQFQPEEEFGVWGLHVWIWRHNPEGMFAEANPNVSCDPTS